MPVNRWEVGLLIGLMLGIGSTSRADWLYFARGGQAELPAEVAGETVTGAAPGGPLVFPRSALRAIVSGASLLDEWDRRRASAEQTGTAQARFAAAWWALEQGMTPEAVAMFRGAASADGASDHAPLARVVRMLDQLDVPVGEPDLSQVRPVLRGSGWTLLNGHHVALWHQASATDAADRVDLVDRVITSYYLSLAAQGVELSVPTRRLVSVWFARQSDYAATLRGIEAAPFATTQGYYHPGFGVVFAFDTRSSFEQAGPRQDLDKRRLASDLNSDQQAEINRQSLLLDLRWRAIDLGIAAHETVHQLVAASGLARRFDDWPNWLHEGFSAQFEVVRDGRWAGIGRINDQRLPDWRSIRSAAQLPPLLRDSGLQHGYHRDLYAESWALVYFLRKTRPSEFVNFLNSLRNPRPRDLESTSESAFRAAFGDDLGSLQTEWRQFLRARTLPAEDHDPRKLR